MQRPVRLRAGVIAAAAAGLLLQTSAFAQQAERATRTGSADPSTQKPSTSKPSTRKSDASKPGSDGSPIELLDDAVSRRSEANQELGRSQERIDELSDETDRLLTRYQAALRQVESLHTYNGQLEELLASQRAEQESLRQQLDRIEEVTRDVTPLMLRMIQALEAFVKLDVPFLLEERQTRIAGLWDMMRRADVTEAEKYRRLMEAYQIENEYGRTIEAYRSTLPRGDREITVDFLRVGRIALVYQTLDESESGAWNQRTRSWEKLDSSYHSAIREGLRVARKQAAPDLLQLPLPPPESVEGAL